MNTVADQDDTLRLDLPASYKYLNVLTSCLSEMLGRFPELPDVADLASAAGLAVHEIGVNIVDHAYVGRTDGRIRISLEVTAPPRSLIVTFEDSGVSFDPAVVPISGPDEPQEEGYGLFLAHNLLDQVVYSHDDNGNRWHLVKHLQPRK